MLTVVNSLTKW